MAKISGVCVGEWLVGLTTVFTPATSPPVNELSLSAQHECNVRCWHLADIDTDG